MLQLEAGRIYLTAGGWLATIIGRHYTGIGWSVQHHREPERMNVRWHRDDGSLSCLYPDWSLAEPG